MTNNVQDGGACRREIETLACGVRETLPHDPVPLRVVQVEHGTPACTCPHLGSHHSMAINSLQQSFPTNAANLAAQAINNHLYSVHGFRGNEQDFYNTDNSCLNKARLLLHAS